MRAARVSELGAPPDPVEMDPPSGGTVVEMEVVSLNPIDLAVCAGRFYGGHPEPPFVPGCEGVGRADGGLVYVFGGGLGLHRDGTLAERRELRASGRRRPGARLGVRHRGNRRLDTG